MKRVLNKKMVLFGCLLVCVLVAAGVLSSCRIHKDDGNKIRDLEFSVVGETEVPAELQKIIAGKMATPFKLTYSNDQNLYIVVGYGQQETGGYSISVQELYLTDNSIVLATELTGPQPGENAGVEPSFPYIVIRTEYLENPVVFQ